MRLRHPEDFQRVWSDGRSMAHPLFILWLRRNETTSTRIGIIASRRIGKAVTRNLVRRRMREACRKIYPELECGWDIVLVARSALVNVKSPYIEDSLRSMLVQAKIIVPSQNPGAV